MKKNVLVVEDDANLADGLRINLELEGYYPLIAGSAEAGMDFWRLGDINLILLDVMLPDMDGFEFCRQIRCQGDRVPILFLTACGTSRDRVRGLEQGGDDYITKPFELQELLARIKSIFRREEWLHEQMAPDQIQLEECIIDLRKHHADTPKGRTELKDKEVMILRLLAEHPNEPITRKTILDRVWGSDAYPTTRTVDNFIVGLRKTIEKDPARPMFIKTVHGVGYRLDLDAPPESI